MMCSAGLTCSYMASAWHPNTCWEREGDENNGGAGFEQVRPANHRKDSSSVLRKTG